MSSFFGSIDLAALKGAKLLSGLDEKNPKRNYVCIPLDWNEIQVRPDEHALSGYHANMRVNIWAASEKFRQSCIQNRMARGESMDGYNPPSHNAEVGFSQDFQKRAMESAKKRILAEHPDWNTVDLQDENINKELRNLIYNAVRIRLGSIYAHVPKGQSTYQGVAESAGAVGGYQQPDPTPSYDDLPF